jgi:phenylpropionate dioxygenase-like ring-hydroxylating dioxygenase large terminal subunit
VPAHSLAWPRHRRLVENALDFAHAEFVHFVGRRGAEPGYRVPDYGIVEHDWGATAEVSFPRQARGLWRHFSNPDATTRASNTFHGPAQFVTRIRIDEYRTRSFLLNARNFFTSRLFDRISDRRKTAIVREDQAILERLEPALALEGTTAGLSVRTDAIQLAYRRRLDEWQAGGWRIDAAALHRERPGERLHMLPSPGRRETRNWVFDSVPLCGANTGVESAAGH